MTTTISSTTDGVVDPALVAWLGPVPSDAPLGPDPRPLPAYQSLREEIAKLESPGAGPCRWEVVERDATIVLASSKDLSSAAYLAGALAQRRGIEGLALGTALLAELLRRFDALHPLRPRARANALAWFLDRAEHEAGTARASAADRAHVTRLQDAVAALRGAADERLGADAPATRRLADAVQRLVLSLPAETATTTPSAASANAHSSADARESASAAPHGSAGAPASASAPGSATIGTGEAANASGTANAPGTTSAPADGSPNATATLPAPASAPAVPTAPVPEPPQDLGKLAHFLAQVGSSLAATGSALRAARPHDAEAMRLLLAGLYLPVVQVPSTTRDRRTGLPGPASALRSEIDRLRREREPARLLDVATRALDRHRFWLDLHLAIHEALGALGAVTADAREVHRGELRNLIARLPGLLDVELSDGTPFASGETRAWLESLASHGGEGTDAGTTSDASPGDDALREARELLRAGKTDGALARAHAAVRLAPTARERFVARLELATVALDAKAPQVALAIAAELHREATARELAEWDPPLAARAAALYLRAAAGERDPAKLPVPHAEAYARLCLLDPAAAASLARI